MAHSFSTAHLDYLQRIGFSEALPVGAACTSAPPQLRRLWQVRGIGWKSQSPPMTATPDLPVSASEATNFARASTPLRLPSEDALVGLYGFKIPLALVIRGASSGVSIALGAWSSQEREQAAGAVLDQRRAILAAALASLYPGVELGPIESLDLSAFPLSGMVLGVPTVKAPRPGDGALPLDRLIRALSGSDWACLVLAEPVDESVTRELRHGVINEIRLTLEAAETAKAPSPLAERYISLLEAQLLALSRAQAVGAWRTAVYLLGDHASYYRLAAVWRGIFSGAASLPEPVRVQGLSHGADLANRWAMPDVAALPGPGAFQHLFQHQTLLNSSQLAAYVHLPNLETSGFSVKLVPDFDVVPPPVEGSEPISVGRVVERARQTGNHYLVDVSRLKRHALIAGMTGSGKTNTIFHLLIQLWRRGLPFLVLEPAKTEYRALLTHDSIGPDLRVFTLGDEKVAPLRLNPFQVASGVSVATHIDLLKSVFNASFGMWNPLPQVLERCIHEVYRDYGWDTVRNVNTRLSESAEGPVEATPDAFPTLTDLYEQVEEVVEQLGYEERVTSDIKAALLTRINSLRIGGKGVMFDTQQSTPIDELLSAPTILELEPIGDDDEKAFAMGLLLIKIYEHLRAHGAVEGADLQHVVVVEEAHRLLANVPTAANQEQPNTRGKAVETFANMLSEVRAYGEGVLIAEQIPAKLAPDVVKNTNLKIVHRLVAGDDQTVLSQTMNMSPRLARMLATLSRGQAAVFSEGDDKPLLVKVPYKKIKVPAEMKRRSDGDRVVGERMRAFLGQPRIAPLYVPFAECPTACGKPYRYCEEARRIVGDRRFQELFSMLVLSLLAKSDAHFDPCRDLVGFLRSRLAGGMQAPGALNCVAMHGVRWYFAHFGQRCGWPYPAVERLKTTLIRVMLEIIPAVAADSLPDSENISDFAAKYEAACKRRFAPFAECPSICPGDACLFRHHNRLLFRDRGLTEMFEASISEAGRQGEWRDWQAVEQAVLRLGSGLSPGAQRSIGLCYGMQQIQSMPGMTEAARALALRRLIADFDAREPTAANAEPAPA